MIKVRFVCNKYGCHFNVHRSNGAGEVNFIKFITTMGIFVSDEIEYMVLRAGIVFNSYVL